MKPLDQQGSLEIRYERAIERLLDLALDHSGGARSQSPTTGPFCGDWQRGTNCHNTSHPNAYYLAPLHNNNRGVSAIPEVLDLLESTPAP